MAKRTNSQHSRSQVTSAPKPQPAIVRLAQDITDTEALIQTNVTQNVELQIQQNKLQRRIDENIEEGRNLKHVLATLHRDMDKHTSTSR
jgi:regulator of replication initiation timing